MNPFSFVVVSDLIYLSLKVNIGNRKILFSEYFCPQPNEFVKTKLISINIQY